MRSTHSRTKLAAGCAVMLSWLLPAGVAAAGPEKHVPTTASGPSILVERVDPMGTFGGRDYVQIEGLMVGAVHRGDGSTGSYRAPVRAAVPLTRGNGVGVVGLTNSAAWVVYPHEGLTADLVLDTTILATGDYLFENGYTYLAVTWHKSVTDFFGADPPDGEGRGLVHGTIERGSDAYQIIKDAARVLRGPASWHPGLNRTIAVGQSQAAWLLASFAHDGLNGEAGQLLYDGFLLSAQGGGCIDAVDEVAVNFNAISICPGPLPADQGKAVVLQTESDLPFFNGGVVRGESATYRVYELAGVAHIPQPFVPLAGFGAVRQNPADFAPAYRAAIANLETWVTRGTPPPPSRFLAGTVAADGSVTLERDADGNALGGLRLPHMPVTLPNGRPAGAPLGSYNGIDPSFLEPLDLFLVLGGTFSPFGGDELQTRYGSQSEYVGLVSGAARALRRDGYILAEDQRRYEEIARLQSPVQR